MHAKARRILLGCFFLTGATGLLYELVWARMLELYFGGTQYAIATVLTTFMAGLGLGSALGGRLADRIGRPLWLYGAAEVAIGMYCIATPTIFAAIGALYLSLLGPEDLARSAFRPLQVALAAAALAPPALLMGTTLPILVRTLVTGRGQAGARIGSLYALNTFGAVLGCVGTGFFALRWLGVAHTLYASGALDIALGAVVLLLARRLERPSPGSDAAAVAARPHKQDRARERPGDPGLRVAVPLAFALSGFSALAYEVLWFRVLQLVIGSSVYAFAIMLATFLAGIAAGSALFSRWLPRFTSPLRCFAVFELVIAFCALIGLALFGELPGLFLALFALVSEHFWLFLALQSAICAAIMLVPTLCMGALFPTAAELYARKLDALGSDVGDLYLWNTLGAIAGALSAGFALQPLLGIQRSILVVATLNLLIGVAVLLWSGSPAGSHRRPRGGSARKSRRRAARERAAGPPLAAAGTISAAFVLTIVLVPGWDARRMTVGPYVNHTEAGRYLAGYAGGKAKDELLYYREGVNAVISVRRARDGSWLSYQANGKWEGTVGESAPNWSLLGHIPLLLAEAPRRALLVGLGTGVTLGALTHYPLDRIDVVEIEPAVVEAAHFFSEAHGDALSDPRVHVHLCDGRTYLGATPRRYDVIVSGVSDPWISGVSNLFTREYFEQMADRLEDDGVAAVWFQNYRISAEHLKTALNTLASVFPDVSVWAPWKDPADLILIASRRSLSIDASRLFDRLATHPDAEGLRSAGVSTIFEFLNLLLLEDADLRAYARGAPLHTDDRPVLEFALPKLMYTHAHDGVIDRTSDLLRDVRGFEPPVVIPEELEASFLYGLASTYSYFEYRRPHAVALFQRVLELDPENEPARRYLEAKGSVPRSPSVQSSR